MSFCDNLLTMNNIIFFFLVKILVFCSSLELPDPVPNPFPVRDPDHPKSETGNHFDYDANTEDIKYWQTRGFDELKKATKIYENINLNKAKNIIIFVGDGMSLETLTAARIYKAQQYYKGTVFSNCLNHFIIKFINKKIFCANLIQMMTFMVKKLC